MKSGTLDTTDTLLLVIDFQERFVPVIQSIDTILKNASIMIQGVQLLGAPVIITEQNPRGLGKTVPVIMDNVENPLIIEKITFSCIKNPEFQAVLDKNTADTIIVCGIESHICVCQTVLDLLINDYRVHVITDGVSSRKSSDYEMSLKRMSSAGAVLSTTEMCLFEMIESADSRHFRKIQSLIK